MLVLSFRDYNWVSWIFMFALHTRRSKWFKMDGRSCRTAAVASARGSKMKIIYIDYTKEMTLSFRFGRLWFKPFHPYYFELADIDFVPPKLARRIFWKFYWREL